MSIATEIARLTYCRNVIRNKLTALGLNLSQNDDLSDCAAAISDIGGTELITDTTTHDVAGKQYARVSDANLAAGNIVSGVTILGVTGTANVSPPQANLEQGVMYYGGENPPSTIFPSSGYDGFSSVEPTMDASPTLIAQNIADGVRIMGVAGTLQRGWLFYSTSVSVSKATKSISIALLSDMSYTDASHLKFHIMRGTGNASTVPLNDNEVYYGSRTLGLVYTSNRASEFALETPQLSFGNNELVITNSTSFFMGTYNVAIYYKPYQ